MSQSNQQSGVGLVEVLVAVLLLSVAVLGFSALQLRAISATDESLVRTQALSVVRGLAENMRANPLQLDAYETTINDPTTTPSITYSSCNALTDACSAAQVAAKESKAAVEQLKKHDIDIAMRTCPGTADFSEIKCVIAAWGDTLPEMSTSDDACANENGTYKSGSTCVIVETY